MYKVRQQIVNAIQWKSDEKEKFISKATTELGCSVNYQKGKHIEVISINGKHLLLMDRDILVRFRGDCVVFDEVAFNTFFEEVKEV